MDAWLAWLIATAIATVGEILIMGFFLAPFAAGALVAAIAALAGAGTAVEVALFAVVTLLCFGLLRPIARRHLHQPAQIRTNTAALIGRTAIVLEPIANDEASGTVRLEGEIWTARSYDEDELIPAGTRVHVVEIRGATALVSP
jgi:membrane protein implicated in regulation of membrane protease activity